MVCFYFVLTVFTTVGFGTTRARAHAHTCTQARARERARSLLPEQGMMEEGFANMGRWGSLAGACKQSPFRLCFEGRRDLFLFASMSRFASMGVWPGGPWE